MFTRILLAVDDTEDADPALDFTVAVARNSSAAVRIVHVNPFIVGGRGYTMRTERQAMEVIDRSVAHLRAAGVEADGVHFAANCFAIDSTIADAAHDFGADVIIFGSSRRKFLRRLGGQGIRERVTGLTGLPTLTAPPPLSMGLRQRVHQVHPELSLPSSRR